MKAAIYARVSTEDQHCDMQLSELGSYCQRMGWEAVEYVEKLSGKGGVRRPQLDQLLADARMRRFDMVLVWKLDAFFRFSARYFRRSRPPAPLEGEVEALEVGLSSSGFGAIVEPEPFGSALGLPLCGALCKGAGPTGLSPVDGFCKRRHEPTPSAPRQPD